MKKFRNNRSEYEHVDDYNIQVKRKSNCCICDKQLNKGELVNKVHYAQCSGFLIQHKYMCLEHEIPHLYIAGYGFKKYNQNLKQWQKLELKYTSKKIE